MALTASDQRVLMQLAHLHSGSNALLTSHLYQILGISIMLLPKIYKASAVRKLDPTRETKSLLLYHHIRFLAREGLAILEVYVLPFFRAEQSNQQGNALGEKLRGAFWRILALYGKGGNRDSPRSAMDQAKSAYATAYKFAEKMPPTDALRLSTTLEYASILLLGNNHGASGETDRSTAKRIAKRAIREVYDSKQGLTDEEFAEASALVKSLAQVATNAAGETLVQKDSGIWQSEGQEQTSQAGKDQSDSTRRRSSILKTPDLFPAAAREKQLKDKEAKRRACERAEEILRTSASKSLHQVQTPLSSHSLGNHREATS
ncbi:hypothetical protein K470DRAFT_168012 [Piedraia hortae CBS 480.64]|uniref:14-3-3 protein n=1 Tax=Piedraia hortae CBS 480.64 TaxID=1314780 RepID=A0A6A7C626_9PEZI|nr:hypothetical protein K470DRAFT_168012 [Piedraia hortae CBS 480.64]